jgi:uncharacterized spore protein YtfJ
VEVKRMLLDELMTTARETLTVTRVYGEPFEKDGVTVLPTATVSGGGGGGGGGGHAADGPDGQGGGFGLGIKPAGMYVIADGQVRWHPAIDVNRLIASITAVVLAAILAKIRIEKLRASKARSRTRAR